MDDLGLMLIEYNKCVLEGGGILLYTRVFSQYRYLTPSPNHVYHTLLLESF